MIHRGRTGALAFLLLATACTGDAEDPKQPESPFSEANRSIIGIIAAADIGEDGQPADPGFVFAPDAPQITVVAHVGDVTGSEMELTWFRGSGDGEEGSSRTPWR